MIQEFEARYAGGLYATMKRISILFFGSLLLLTVGCSRNEPATPAPGAASEHSEAPAANQATEAAKPTSPSPASADESTAKKTGSAVGGALNTAGKATKGAVETGVGAIVKGAKKVGTTTEDAAKGVASGVKGEDKKK